MVDDDVPRNDQMVQPKRGVLGECQLLLVRVAAWTSELAEVPDLGDTTARARGQVAVGLGVVVVGVRLEARSA